MTLIAFVGSVFSPYYAWARRGGSADPANHCALNVATYSPRAARWSMTERGVSRLSREKTHLSIGRSTLEWTAGALQIAVDEICAPVPRRVRGTIRLLPSALGEHSYFLDAAARHRWTPFAPCAHVEVSLVEPELKWSGVAYMDSNFGTEPLENAFEHWTWSRASLPDSAVVLYDVTQRAAEPYCLALRFAKNGSVDAIEPPPEVVLPRTGWHLARRTRADGKQGARVVKTLEDAPFYSRSVLQTHLLGAAAPAIHETLDLNRFQAPWVQCLLPFRMPRRTA